LFLLFRHKIKENKKNNNKRKKTSSSSIKADLVNLSSKEDLRKT